MSTILDYDNIPLNIVNEEGRSILMEVIRTYCKAKECAECVEKLILKGCNVNAQDKKGNTPLIHAIQRGDLDVASLLLKKGAIKDMKNKQGRKAIDYVYNNSCCRNNNNCEHNQLRNLLR